MAENLSEDQAEETPLVRELRAQLAARHDPAVDAGGTPNNGQPLVPHIMSFSSLVNSLSRTYQPADEAIRASLDNARYMENDLGIWSALEQRMRLMALLPWHLEPEDPKSASQRDLCDKLTMLLNRIQRFTAMRYSLQDALWRGKSAVQFKWRKQRCAGRTYVLPTKSPDEEDWGWLPINGDKLVFKYEIVGTSQEGYDTRGLNGALLGPVGIRTNVAACAENMRPYVQTTTSGMAYFPPLWARGLFCIHKHEIKDAAFESPLEAGAIHGLGIRSKLYWEWFQKQELTALMMSFAERSALGIEIWEYPLGNKEAEKAVAAHAMNRGASTNNVILFPKPQGEDAGLFDVRHVEPGLGGLQAIQTLLQDYFGKRMLIYILGQTLSSQAEAAGMGSGLSDLHLDTLMQIIEYDAVNHQETITHELIKWLIAFNFPSAADVHVRFVIDTKSPDAQQKMEGYRQAYEMGARIKESDVLGLIGAAIPTQSDVVLRNPQLAGGTAGGSSTQPGKPTPTPQQWRTRHGTGGNPLGLSSKEELHTRIASKLHEALRPSQRT